MDKLFTQDTEGCLQDTILLKKMTIMENLLTAELPEELDIMPEHLKNIFYPCEDRPEIILSDADGSVQMTFQMFHRELKTEETWDAADALSRCVERLYPENEISPVCLYSHGKTPTGCFFMDMELGDVYVRHVKAVRAVQGQFFLITMTYPKAESGKWQAVLKHLFSTLREKDRTRIP